jgi:5'-deoxynucleotidase YfbR-like HD superfamily hydrolase
MSTKLPANFSSDTAELGELLMAFAKVYRATYIDYEGTHESDTDHTTMLAIMACAIASSLNLSLDIGKIAQYAVVHDLVEVYSGDVNTVNFFNIDHAEKEKNEALALAKIRKKFGKTFPWIHETIEAYESLEDAESRYIKTLDKLMPAITHIYTDGRAVDEGFDDPKAFEESVLARGKHMRETFAHDQEIILQLRDELLRPTIHNKYEKHRKKK